jgi:D-beta-D-heptose 7-phosphate kinase/D-beta-D-heptose 1-phosphate adenosyltransferase
MYQNLLKTVTNLGSPAVLLVGDFMLDSYVYGDALRISPEAPVPVLKVVKREYNCGGAGSVAVDLAALGAKPVCLGVIGNDTDGTTLARMLTDAGADVANLLVLDDRPTISKQRLIGLAQHRHRQQMIRIDEEVTEPLEKKYCDEFIRVFNSKLPAADIVCLQDYNKGVLAPDLCRELIRLARTAGKKVLVDPSPITDYSKYAGATLITPNRTEASLAVGFAIETADKAREAANILAKQLDLDAVVITLDKEGAWLKTDSLSELVPTVPRTVYDVTGAGDVVLATLAVTLGAGCDYVTSVQLANTAGGIEVEKFGVATVTIDEMVNEIIIQNRGKTGKVRDLDSLVEELKWHRNQKDVIVFTNGCFDVLHRGHIEFLEFCKSQGNIVVVGLNSDSSVKQIKGPERPINNQHDRAAVLAALESVDYVAVFDEPDPLEIVKKVQPDVLVKGEDWANKGVIGREFVEARGGKVVLAKLVNGKSSTATIEKMKALEKED